MPNDILAHTPSRRRFIGVAVATVAAGALSRLAFAETNLSISGIKTPPVFGVMAPL